MANTPNITSKPSEKLWLLLLFFLITAQPLSADSISTTQHIYDYKMGITAFTGYTIPVQEKFNAWEKFISPGISLIFPMQPKDFDLSLIIGMGTLKNKEYSSIDVKILNTILLLSRPIPVGKTAIRFSPGIGLTNTSLFVNKTNSIIDVDIIAAWENEFGFCAGAEFQFLKNKWLISLPFRFQTIFTYPDYFNTINIQFHIGRFF